MLAYLTDEHVPRAFVRGLRARRPDLDVVRVQDVGLRTADDPTVLAWAANHNRVVVTFDRETMPGYAQDRIDQGEPMTGLVVVSDSMSMGAAIDDLLILAECSFENELHGQVQFLPL